MEDPLTGEELQDCLEAIRWPLSTLAEALGREDDDILAWISGAKPIPAKTAAWIKTMADAHMALEMSKPKPRS